MTSMLKKDDLEIGTSGNLLFILISGFSGRSSNGRHFAVVFDRS